MAFKTCFIKILKNGKTSDLNKFSFFISVKILIDDSFYSSFFYYFNVKSIHFILYFNKRFTTQRFFETKRY
jgi:hypothetical protein